MRQIFKTEKKVCRNKGSGEIRINSRDLKKYIGKKMIVKVFLK